MSSPTGLASPLMHKVFMSEINKLNSTIKEEMNKLRSDYKAEIDALNDTVAALLMKVTELENK